MFTRFPPAVGMGMLFLLLAAGLSVPARADIHTVRVNEYYTQCDDGSTSTQYIELKPVTCCQIFRQCASIQVKRTVGGADVFFAKPVFVGHSNTESFPINKHFLIATPAFQAKTGVTPDLVMPDGTLDPAGGVIRFAADSGCAINWGTIHEVRYGDQGVAPAPGPNQAANLSGSTFTLGSPSPTNFAGASAISWSCQQVAVPEPGVIPSAFTLGQNHPNPFRSHTTIGFDLPEGGIVRLVVFDANGRLVKTLEYRHHDAGRYSVSWNGENEAGVAVVPGTYFYRLETRGFVQTRKAILLR